MVVGGPDKNGRPGVDEPGADDDEVSIRRHFERLVAGVQDYAVFTLDTGGFVTSWNAGAEMIKGYRAHEIIGKHFSRFYPKETLVTNLPEQELKLAAGQGRVEDEGWRVRKDGTRFWANVVITALRSPAGHLTGFLKITRDLTQRRRHEELLRESEERFRLLVEGVKDYAIFMLDTDGCVASWNLGAERIKGYTAAEIIGRHFSCFYPAQDFAQGVPQRQLATAVSQGSFEEYGWRVRKDGSRFWANVVITALYSRDGVLRGFAKVTRDLTERKQVEALEESRQRAVEFLAMLSHELRNPLAPLKTSVDILNLRPISDPVVSRAREVIARQVDHLTRLLDDLMEVSRVTSGRITLSNDLIELKVAINRAVESARPRIDAKQHSLEVRIPERPLRVRGDLARLTQTLANLLNNAAQYTSPGGRIELAVVASRRKVEIHVRDNGMGIAPDLLPRVFDLFTQGQRPLDRTDGGLGVGLALVHRIVTLHGGTVAANSAGPGCGSDFVVTLPLHTEEASMTVVPNSQPAEQSPPPRRRLLVVDDNKDAAESMSMLLELWGHEVIYAYDGPSALEAASKYHPDAVFLDIGLPGMDGYEIASRLRQMPESARTILVAVTGYGQEEDRRRSRNAGIDHHLVKPVSPEMLHQLIDTLALH